MPSKARKRYLDIKKKQRSPQDNQSIILVKQESKTHIDILNRIRIGAQTLEDIDYLNIIYYHRLCLKIHKSHIFTILTSVKTGTIKQYLNRQKQPKKFLEATDRKSRTCSKNLKIPNDPKLSSRLHKTLELKPRLATFDS